VEPDISFENVPFAALIGPDGKYLGESHSIFVSVDGVSGLPERPHAPLTMSSVAFVIGAPAISEPGLAQLPDAESEAVLVAGHFKTKDLLVGAGATRGLVIKSLPGAELFHFAGHAAVRNGETCLLLSGGERLSEKSGTSAALCSDDVTHADLSHCRMAVLSACSTGRQDDATPLNRHGMASSFLYAGVPHVVASEWDVDSAVTRNLMKHFYEDLLTGKNPAEALRLAGFEIRRDPATSHPYFWAGFQTFGKP
jgi:CHAT domain-containing protein